MASISNFFVTIHFSTCCKNLFKLENINSFTSLAGWATLYTFVPSIVLKQKDIFTFEMSITIWPYLIRQRPIK